MWADKRYHSLDYEMKARYGHKIYKIALTAALPVPTETDTLIHEAVFSAVPAVPEILLHPDSSLLPNRLKKANSCLQGSGFPGKLEVGSKESLDALLYRLFSGIYRYLRPY